MVSSRKHDRRAVGWAPLRGPPETTSNCTSLVGLEDSAHPTESASLGFLCMSTDDAPSQPRTEDPAGDLAAAAASLPLQSDLPPAEQPPGSPPEPETTAPEAPPSLGGMKKAVLSSAAWTMIGFGTMQVLRFFTNIIL